MSKYDDIIHLPHHVSSVHPHMPAADRAAQFSPFAALTGFGEAIRRAQLTPEEAAEADETRIAELNETLCMLASRIAERPLIAVAVRSRQPGGRYEMYTGTLKKIDADAHRLVLEDGVVIGFDDIAEINEAPP